MTTHRQQRRWADSESEALQSVTPLAVQTTFRHMEPSPAVAARIDVEARKLQCYFDRLTRCHAIVIAPHRHHRHGCHFEVHLELTVPGERLAIAHEPAVHAKEPAARTGKRTEVQPAHKDIYVVVREVFDTARRRLEDYARRRRGKTKRRSSPTA